MFALYSDPTRLRKRQRMYEKVEYSTLEVIEKSCLCCVSIRVAIGDVCRGAYTLAGSVVCLLVGDIGIRLLASTTYGWLGLRLGLGFD
jgi:hypothetical protein